MLAAERRKAHIPESGQDALDDWPDDRRLLSRGGTVSGFGLQERRLDGGGLISRGGPQPLVSLLGLGVKFFGAAVDQTRI